MSAPAIDWEPPTLEDHLEYMGATPLGPYGHVMPMWLFDVEHRREIHAKVIAERPPEREIDLGLALIPSRAWYEWHWHRGIDPDRTRPSLPEWKRRAVITRDGYVCGLCGGDVEPNDVHIDHIVPWSLTQDDNLNNLQVAHSRCNLSKGARA